MKVTFERTEWQLRTIAAAIEFYADHVDGDELEQLLNLSLLQQEHIVAADECRDTDKRAIRQEYGL
jgi:hypothetical protein